MYFVILTTPTEIHVGLSEYGAIIRDERTRGLSLDHSAVAQYFLNKQSQRVDSIEKAHQLLDELGEAISVMRINFGNYDLAIDPMDGADTPNPIVRQYADLARQLRTDRSELVTQLMRFVAITERDDHIGIEKKVMIAQQSGDLYASVFGSIYTIMENDIRCSGLHECVFFCVVLWYINTEDRMDIIAGFEHVWGMLSSRDISKDAAQRKLDDLVEWGYLIGHDEHYGTHYTPFWNKVEETR